MEKMSVVNVHIMNKTEVICPVLDTALIAARGWTVVAMAEYIERESAMLLPELPKEYRHYQTDNLDDAYEQGWDDALCCLGHIPAADVAPVVYAHWAHLGGDEWCCSACGFVITTEGSWDKPIKKYCEDCGAKMDKVK